MEFEALNTTGSPMKPELGPSIAAFGGTGWGVGGTVAVGGTAVGAGGRVAVGAGVGVGLSGCVGASVGVGIGVCVGGVVGIGGGVKVGGGVEVGCGWIDICCMVDPLTFRWSVTVSFTEYTPGAK